MARSMTIFITTPFRLNLCSWIASFPNRETLPLRLLIKLQNLYTGFPVPFNECIYQLLNEYWPTGTVFKLLEVTLVLVRKSLRFLLLDGEYVLSIYLLIAIFSDWKHRWRNTIYIVHTRNRNKILHDLTGRWWFYFQHTKNICYISTQHYEGKFQKRDVYKWLM
jgi:hypothetical protein